MGSNHYIGVMEKNPQRKEGCCATCNYNDWVVPNGDGRWTCENTWECFRRVLWMTETRATAEFLTELRSLCERHLEDFWGFRNTRRKDAICPRCAEEARR